MDDIQNVMISGISDKMVLIVDTYRYGAISTTDEYTMGYYVVNFIKGPL